MFKLVCPCHFGLESVTKKEIQDLNYNILEVSDGKVIFEGDEEAIARANINLRTAERVLIEIAKFKATSYEELFQFVKQIDFKKYLDKKSKFTISKATSIRSKLFSQRDIQSITKKAMVDNLMQNFNVSELKEEGIEYKFRVNFYKDEASVLLDTSGDSLHKRGYRLKQGLAPIAENLAAAIIMLTPYKKFGREKYFIDPFCGSGTFPIECALINSKIAPGLNRHFLSENYTNFIDKSVWDNAFSEAKENVDYDYINNATVNISGFDIDKKIIPIAKENAKRAGVLDQIHFEVNEVKNLKSSRRNGIIITNPPYGERLEDEESLPSIYTDLKNAYRHMTDFDMYVITAYEKATKFLGKEYKNRKIYNGMIKSYLYQYSNRER